MAYDFNISGNLPDRKRPYGSALRSVITAIQTAINETLVTIGLKAPADHTHDGVGSALLGRGDALGRPASGGQMAYINTDDARMENLDENGALLGQMPYLGGDAWTGEHDFTGATVSVAAPTAPAHATNKAYVDGRILGYRLGLTPRYKDADELYIGAGALEIDGAVYTLTAETAMLIDAALGGAFAASTPYFLAFSAPAAGMALSAADLSVTTAQPTWDAAKRGWYDASGARVFNRCMTNSASNLDYTALWSGPRGERLGHEAITLLNDTTPAAGIEAINAKVPPWGVPVIVGGFGALRYTSSGVAMYIYSGSAAVSTNKHLSMLAKTQAANVAMHRWFTTITNADGNIYHMGESYTYTDYSIYKNWDIMPEGV